jgi:AcrR family transcriptional regulator
MTTRQREPSLPGRRRSARRRTGRRPGDSGSREAILTAAREQFAERGYDHATIRGIAAAAGVDPALVMYFFGSKQQLFLASIELLVNPAEAMPRLLEAGPDGLGERVARFFLGNCESEEAGPAFVGLIRSAFSNEDAAALLRRFVSSEVIGRLASALDRPDAELHAELAGSHLVGLLVARYIVKVEPLASTDRETIIAAIAPTIQRYLDGERPVDAASSIQAGR